jgi:hypothetical protein
MRGFVCLLAGVAMSVVGSVAARADCPPNASPSFEANNVVHCKCDAGFENRDGECKMIPVMREKPEPTMRAQTRAECVRDAGRQLRTDLDKCSSPIVECMTNAGVRIHQATCAASTLVSALAVAMDPTKASAIVAPAIAGSVVMCGREAYDAVEKCEPAWGACSEEPLKTHKTAIAECPGK